jgi:hypothetical protein
MFKKLERSQGFTPAALCSPTNAITPEQVIHHHCSKRRVGEGGQALPPPSSYLCFSFHILITGITMKKTMTGRITHSVNRVSGSYIRLYQGSQ